MTKAVRVSVIGSQQTELRRLLRHRIEAGESCYDWLGQEACGALDPLLRWWQRQSLGDVET